MSLDGHPFNETAQACLDQVSKIDAGLAEYHRVAPNEEAQDILHTAIENCEMGTKAINSHDSYDNYEGIASYLKTYNESLAEAKQLDKKVNTWRTAEVADCESNFVAEFEVFKGRYEQLQAVIQEREAAKLAARKKHIASRNARAKTLGYKGVYFGITRALNNVKSGKESITDIQPYLIEANWNDEFQVQSIANPYVIYGYHNSHDEFIQIAVLKDKNQFYSEDAALVKGLYKLLGIEEFTTVLGVTKQVLVLERVAS